MSGLSATDSPPSVSSGLAADAGPPVLVARRCRTRVEPARSPASKLEAAVLAGWSASLDAAGPDGSAAWSAIVAGRWSVRGRFDSDGRRFWIAIENDSASIAERRLTDVEQIVVSYLVAGHAQKVVASELGVSQGSISKLVTGACRKLGVRHRAELMSLHAALAAR